MSGEAWLPTRMAEIELAAPLPLLADPAAGSAPRPTRTRVLVRLHGIPLGICEVGPGAIPDPDGVAAVAWAALRGAIEAHLRADGLEPPACFDGRGLATGETPRCVRERDEFLVDAPPVSVVIATRNRTARLEACLRSLLGVHYARFEIIVVDNGPSSDDTMRLLRGAFGSEHNVLYVRQDSPGAASARNRGAREASHSIIAFLDDDVLVDRAWLAAIAGAFDAGSDVGCVTGLILPAEIETPAQALIEEFGGFTKGFSRRVYDPRKPGNYGRLFPYAAGAFGSGANMAFSATVLRAIGGFDPALGPGTAARGGEDLAAFITVLLHGHSLVYEPNAIVRHNHHRGYASLQRQIEGYGLGLSACMTKLVADDPVRVLDIARRAPAGLVHLLGRTSPKNRAKGPDYPLDLTVRELSGLLRGPLAYLWARRTLARRGPDDLGGMADG
jgi:GT2 family glycosyltransferase